MPSAARLFSCHLSFFSSKARPCSNRLPSIAAVALILISASGLMSPSHAQSISAPRPLAVTGTDRAAGEMVMGHSIHAKLAHGVAHSELFWPAPRSKASLTTVPGNGFYPSDLSYGGGPLVTSTQSHALYVNCTNVTQCWGSPEGFLVNLGASNFVHIIDQYVGQSASGRYTDGAAFAVNYPKAPHVFGDSDILGIVHAAVVANGRQGGYRNVFHVFLPPGTDICSNLAGGGCYSPDNSSSFYFCAYHGSVTFSDVGHVLYTVEPYQAVPGCQEQRPQAGYPNGALADSTNSVLSHELFETITDPDNGTGWTASNSLDVYGAEIGDLCQTPTGGNPVNTIGSKAYQVQLEYSDTYHACAATP